jgi:dUTP pyrophosphatase
MENPMNNLIETEKEKRTLTHKSNTLFVATNPGYTLDDLGSMAPKKDGDVGIDLPVRIKGMQDVKKPDGTPYIKIENEPEINNYLVNYDAGYIDIPAGRNAELATAIHVKIPDNAWGAIRPRSSTGWKRRLIVFDGTIDSGFTGMLCCLVHNPTANTVRIVHNDRLAQLVLIPKYDLQEIAHIPYEELPDTSRGQSGFGSTGG